MMSQTDPGALHTCRHCYGSGDCFSCSGRGLIAADVGGQDDCRACGGSGRCVLCSGSGEVVRGAERRVPTRPLAPTARS